MLAGVTTPSQSKGGSGSVGKFGARKCDVVNINIEPGWRPIYYTILHFSPEMHSCDSLSDLPVLSNKYFKARQ